MMSKRPLSTDSIGNVTAENRKRGRIASDDLETSRAKISQQRANSEYTVGWICAITTESVAARAFLDEEYSGLEAVAQHDNNSYILGKIGCHNVVIAVLPDAEYGTTSAAAVARDMLHSFPNVRIGLMVGIGGGAPSLKHDIRLGDVVVSSPGGGKGGVFQYDFGKTIQNQTFQETAFLDQPPTVLRTAVSTLKGIHDMKGHQLVDDVEMALKKIKKRKKYRKPPPASDRLYRSGVIHPSHSPESCEIACGNDEANLLVRDKREEEDDDPAIHYGLIASGNQLMKDAHIRDKLADENGILCFEMEAAGLMNHFPCLVIRGICDYSDSHKNKDWQEYAAMMAAAYAKDLLRQIPSNKVERERRIGEVVDLLQEGLRCLCQTANETKAEVETMRRNHHLAGVERWLCPPDTSTNFNEARKKWHEGSGLWFLDSPAFNEWKCGSHYLWLHGLAGCGKTILSATIVDHLQKMDDCIVLQFYFDFNNTTKQKVDGVLRSLVFQLGSSSKELGSLYQSHFGCQSQPDNPSLTKTLHTMMKNSKTTYLVMDALDECTEREELLQWMMEFFKAPDLGHVRLIATSRPEEVFLRRIPSWIGKKHCLKLDKEAINADIRSYVTTKLEQSPDFLEKELSHNLLKRIRNKVGDRADGMFRWAACQLASLAKCMSPRDIETALETLPWDLNETYQRMLQNIPANLKKDAIRLLQFLVHGKRPLTLREAVEIIATQTDEEPRSFDLKRRLFRDNDILQYCPNLVSVINIVDYKGARKELHLAHFSVKEYLLKEGQFDLSLASIAITRTCLTYLTDIEGRLWEIKERFPMARYAAEYWMDYAALAERSEDVVQTSTKFLQDESTFQRWDQLYRARNELTSVPASKQESRLYYACLGGLVAVSRALIDGGADVNVQGGHYGTALQAAANGGHRDITQLLLDRGADINAKGGIYGTALLAASQGGYRDIVQLLLDRGADANAQDGDCNNALLAASQGGYRDIVQLLLDRGADVNAQGGDYDNGLQAASHGGYQDIVQLLLDRGADANAKGSHYGTALLVASEGGHQDIVQLLLDRGADVSAQGGDYDNALQAASQGGHRDIVQLLLDRGADVNAQGGDYDNALQAASHGGYQDIVQLLLDRGADANAQGSHYGTALLVALNSGHRNIFQLLLDRGADVNAKSDHYGTVLLAASQWGYRDIVQLLLDRGADVNAKGSHYGTALLVASKGGYRDIVQLLLDKGADINAKGGLYDNALAAASQGGHRDTVQLLLDRGADVNAKGSHYGTALLVASKGGHRDIVQLLLDRGADVSAQGGDYDNALQAASQGGYQDIVQLLLDRGADVNAKGSHYGTALLVASKGGHRDIVQLLLDKGADINAKGGLYDNALAAASQGGHRDTVQLLLDRGADVNAKGGLYDNALAAASRGGHRDIVQLLLDRGADVNAKGGIYDNALQAAAQEGHQDTFQLLLDRGADIRASNKNGRTPFILASGRGCRATELSATAATANRKGVTVLSATGLSTD